MEEIMKFIFGIFLLALGIPIGDLLAKITKEELKSGRKWFQILVALSLIGAVIFLILGNDAVLFGLLFIAVVTSRSLRKTKKKKQKS